jgi:integrase/recombinase XerC/integrase/recombinase XerD
MKLRESFDYFILNRQLRGCTDVTITGYKFYIDYFLRFLEGKNIADTDDITLIRVNEFHLHLRNKEPKISQISVNTYLRTVRAFINFLQEESVITKDDIGGKMILPKTEKPAIEILTNDEISVILACNSNKSELGRRNRAMLHVMLDCGLRADEVANLKYQDINFNQRYLKVLGKGKKERIVPVGLKTCKSIMDYIYKRRFVGEIEHVFLTKELQKMTTKSITQTFARLKKKSGVVRLYAHLCRHTFATNFLLYGIGDVYQLSQILGHSNVKTTEIYLHIANYYQIVQKQKKKSVSFFDSFYN